MNTVVEVRKVLLPEEVSVHRQKARSVDGRFGRSGNHSLLSQNGAMRMTYVPRDVRSFFLFYVEGRPSMATKIKQKSPL